jgi:Electron transfer DM13
MPPTQTKPRGSVAVSLLAAAIVVVTLLVGIWVAGGVVTNDFGLAMLLTVVWMAIAGLACVAVGRRSRRLRLPVIGAYLVTAAVAGIYLGRSTLLDDEVHENVARAAPDPPSGRSEHRPDRPRNVLLARGRFEGVAHDASGTASAIRLAAGGRVLTLTAFEVDNGPDLRVYLVAGRARDESEVDEFEDLGGLKGNKGNQQYDIPRGLNLHSYSTVVIWCRAFSVNFARAPLR